MADDSWYENQNLIYASSDNERTFDFRNASNMGDDKFWISENASADDEQWIFENALAIVMMNSKLRHCGLIIFFFLLLFLEITYL